MKITDEMIEAADKAYAWSGLMCIALEAALAVVLDPATERDAAVAAIERVRAIHEPEGWPLHGGRESKEYCSRCNCRWPCSTVAALDGAPEPVDHSELIVEARQAVLAMDYVRAYQGGLVGRLADALEGLEKRNDPR